MLLAIDIGNSNIVFGVYRGAELVAHWRAVTDPRQTADEYSVILSALFAQHGLSFNDLDGWAICSVVPDLTHPFTLLARRCCGCDPLIVGPGIRTGMRILYEPPQSVGPDRIVDAVGARHHYGAPVIAIDFGTATTFNVVSAEGDFVGGAITAGVGISTEALVRSASRLLRIDLVAPQNVIGRNTEQAFQAGVVYGYAALVNGLVRRLQSDLGYPTRVVATGGLAGVIAPQTTVVDTIDQGLTLEGLRLLYELNQG